MLLDYLIDERALTKWCTSVSFDIQAYFDYVHPHGTWVGSALSSALALPLRAAMLPLDAIEYSSAKSSGEFGASCNYHPEQIDNWMSFWKNLQESGVNSFVKFGDQQQKVARREEEARHGSCAAMTELGRHYEWGTGIERDRKKAVDLYKRAAACGDGGALYMLGHHTLRGELPGSEDGALALFSKCAATGNHSKCNVMADMLIYKRTFLTNKYLTVGPEGSNAACRGIASTGWLRRWTSPGPKLVF